MRYRDKLVRNSLFVTGSRLIRVVCNLILTPVIIHSIGVEGYGIWALFSAVSAYFVLLDMGIGNSFVKFYAQFLASKDMEKFKFS